MDGSLSMIRPLPTAITQSNFYIYTVQTEFDPLLTLLLYISSIHCTLTFVVIVRDVEPLLCCFTRFPFSLLIFPFDFSFVFYSHIVFISSYPLIVYVYILVLLGRLKNIPIYIYIYFLVKESKWVSKGGRARKRPPPPLSTRWLALKGGTFQSRARQSCNIIVAVV